MIRKLLPVAVAAAAILATAAGAHTARQGSRQIDVQPIAHLALDRDQAVERLAASVRLRTIAYDDQPDASAAEFVKLMSTLNDRSRTRTARCGASASAATACSTGGPAATQLPRV